MSAAQINPTAFFAAAYEIFQRSMGARIANSAYQNSLAVPNSDPDCGWRDDPNIRWLFEKLARPDHVGLLTRRNGGHELTHYIEVANWVVHCPELRHLDPAVVAYAGAAHDAVEMLRSKGYTIEDFLPKTWQFTGPKLHQSDTSLSDKERWPLGYLRTVLNDLTDEEGLRGQARLDAQIQLANADETGLVRYIRFADKYRTFIRDLDALQENPQRFLKRNDPEKYLKLLDKKNYVVNGLDIKQVYKDNFGILCDKIREELTHAAAGQTPQSPVRRLATQACAAVGGLILSPFR